MPVMMNNEKVKSRKKKKKRKRKETKKKSSEKCDLKWIDQKIATNDEKSEANVGR